MANQVMDPKTGCKVSFQKAHAALAYLYGFIEPTKRQRQEIAAWERNIESAKVSK